MSEIGLKKRLEQSVDLRKKLIESDHPQLSIRSQCELLAINRSSFYYQPQPETDLNLELMSEIDKLYTRWPYLGAVKITDNLFRRGYPINHKRIGRLMKKMGIQAIYPKKNTSKAHPDHKTYPYLLKKITADHPNHIWGADITYIQLAKGWAYLVAILDWYSRYVLAWKLSPTLEASFCAETLAEALAKATPEYSNTDQGSQFTTRSYIDQLEAKGVKISMDGRGRCFDNIFNERLWRSVKYEEVYLHDYQSLAEAEQSLTVYFHDYNYERLHHSLPHPTLRLLTPAEVYFQQTNPKVEPKTTQNSEMSLSILSTSVV